MLYTGIYSVIGLVYVSEMSPSHIRGRLALASYLHTGGGILSGSIAVGLFSLDSKHAYTIGWRLDILHTVVKYGSTYQFVVYQLCVTHKHMLVTKLGYIS